MKREQITNFNNGENPKKKRKISKDNTKHYVIENANKYVTKEQEMQVHSLILTSFQDRIGYFAASDIHNYHLTCKEIAAMSNKTWKMWFNNWKQSNKKRHGITTKSINLFNNGNLCFMNVCYHALHNIQEFFPNFQPQITDEGNQFQIQAIKHLNNIMEILSITNKDAANDGKNVIQQMLSLLKEYGFAYGDGHQHDARGYLEFLINSFYPKIAIGDNLTPEIIGGEEIDTIKCCKEFHCLSQRKTVFIFKYLSIPPCYSIYNKIINIQLIINKNTSISATNMTTGRCTACGNNTATLINTITLSHLPKVFMFGIPKQGAKVKLSETIKLNHCADSKNVITYTYDLIGFIVHKGTLLWGHYYYYSKIFPNIFRCFNDKIKEPWINQKMSLSKLQEHFEAEEAPVVALYKRNDAVKFVNLHTTEYAPSKEAITEDIFHDEQEMMHQIPILSEKPTLINENDKWLVKLNKTEPYTSNNSNTNVKIDNKPINWTNINTEEIMMKSIEYFGYPAINKALIDSPIKLNQKALMCISAKGSMKATNFTNRLDGKKIITLQQETGSILIIDSVYIHILRENKGVIKVPHNIFDLENSLVSIKCNDKYVYVTKGDTGHIFKFKMQNGTLAICGIMYDQKARMPFSDFAVHDNYIIHLERQWISIYKEIDGEILFEFTYQYPRGNEVHDPNDAIQTLNVTADYLDQKMIQQQQQEKNELKEEFIKKKHLMLNERYYPTKHSTNANWLFIKNKQKLFAIHPLNNNMQIINSKYTFTMTAISEHYGIFALIEKQMLAQFASNNDDINIMFDLNSDEPNTKIIKSLFKHSIVEFDLILYDECYGISGQLIIFCRNTMGYSYFKLFNYDEYNAVKIHLQQCFDPYVKIADKILSKLY